MGQVKTIKRGELARHGYVPPDGTTGQVLKKTSDDDSDTEFGDPIKSGGTEGQTFRKNSTDDFDGKWEDQFPIVTEESSRSVTPINFTYREKRARRYLVPNDPSEATNNATALKALFDPDEAGFRGRFILDGSEDTYYIDDIIAFREGVTIEGEDNKLLFTKSYESTDDSAGFIYAVKDFVLRNCEIEVDYNGNPGTAAGNIIKLGNRSATGSRFVVNGFTQDALLPEPWGNIQLSNLKLSTNNPAVGCVAMLGGLRDVAMENIRIDGGEVATRGITYEFGFATNNADPTLRESSHLNNLTLRNIRIEDTNTTSSIALRLAGAYNCSVEGLYINGCQEGVNCTPGEALFYQPWTDTDDVGAKRNMTFRNVVIQGNTGTGMTLNGSSDVSGSYLNAASPALDDIDQVDLYDFIVDGFAIDPVSTVGITTSGGKVDLRNGVIRGATFSIQMTDECTQFLIENVNIFDTTSTLGMRLNFASGGIFATPRKKTGMIRNCFIAGTGGAAIGVDHAESITVENCRFGYEMAHDGKAETTQTNAINCGADAHMVARDNYVAGNTGANAYTGVAGGEGILINPRGIQTSSSVWGNYVTNADTAGATLVALETEVNQLKQTLRDVGIIET